MDDLLQCPYCKKYPKYNREEFDKGLFNQKTFYLVTLSCDCYKLVRMMQCHQTHLEKQMQKYLGRIWNNSLNNNIFFKKDINNSRGNHGKYVEKSRYSRRKRTKYKKDN